MHKRYIDFDIYVFIRNNIIDIKENFIIEKDKIEQKEKESFSYEQKFRDLKICYVIVLLKNPEDQIKNVIINLTVFTLIMKNAQKKYYSDLKKERKHVIQCINSKYCICRNLRILDEYINFSFDAGIYFSNKKEYCHILSMYQFYNEINKEKNPRTT